MNFRLLFPVALVAATAACSTPGQQAVPLIADKSLQLTATRVLPLAEAVGSIAAVAAILLIYDPLAPNWEIEETRLSEDTFRYSLKMKRYHTGGAGESMQVLKRRISQVQHGLGYGSYQLLEYSEGIDSQTLGARRYAEGVVRLTQRLESDSFLQNGRN